MFCTQHRRVLGCAGVQNTSGIHNKKIASHAIYLFLGPIGNVSLQAKLYNLIKSIDPYHLILGAIQCTNAWMWSDVESYVPSSPPTPGAAVIPFGHQPALQLSLDSTMWEDYYAGLDTPPWPDPRPPSSSPPATTAAAPVSPPQVAARLWGEDVDNPVRFGAWFEPIINCQGLWYLGSFNDYPATPSASRSRIWLSIVNADIPNQLAFVLEENSWGSPYAVADDGWLQTVAVSRAGAEIRMLAPSLFPTFGSFQPEPYQRVRIATATLLRSDVPPDSSPLRARAWREQCGSATNSSGHCVHIVVVNTIRDSPVAFTLQLLLPQLAAEGGVFPGDYLPTNTSTPIFRKGAKS